MLAFVLLAALVSMAVYGLAGLRRDSDATRKGSQFLMGTGDFLVHWFMWVLGPLDRAALRLGLAPDAFNFAGLGLGILAGVLIASGHLHGGGWAIAAGGVCDILDGRLARALKVDSPYGKFIDSTFYRFVEVFVFLGFAYYLRGFAFGPVMATAAICGSLLVSYARARGESVGVECKEGLMQRAERLVLTCLVCLTDGFITRGAGWPPGTAVVWVVTLIAVGTFVTAAHRTLWIANRLRRRRQGS